MVMLLLFATLIWIELATCGSYNGFTVYRLTPTGDQLDLLRRFEDELGFDIWTKGRVANDPLDIMVAPEDQFDFREFLFENHISCETLIEDLQVEIDAERKRQNSARTREGVMIEFDRYYEHPEINAYLTEVAAKYPSVASVVTIGRSTEGRDLNILKISRGRNNSIIWMDAGIHAREWIAPATALYVINQLLENSAHTTLLDGVDWHILPVVNPDGYQYSHTESRMWRKTRSKTSSPGCVGVDGNRNWDFHWNGPGSSDDPCMATYRGPKPFSEPETAAVRDHLLANAARTALYLTFHSFGSCFLYPWGWTSDLPDNWKVMDDLARKANAAQIAAGGDSYRIGSSTNLLGENSGGSDDWALGAAKIPLSYTIELPGGGRQGFDPPASTIQKTGKEIFAAVVVFGDHVRGAIVDEATHANDDLSLK